jgi:hypothetical protein
LKQPLGQRITTPHQHWQWFIHQDTQDLCKQTSDRLKQLPKHQGYTTRQT